MRTWNEVFAERLKAVRERKGFSQYALARLTGLTKQSLSKLEQGGSDPSWTTVQLLAAALDVDYADFADPGLTLPDLEPANPRGRPRKVATETNGTTATAKTARKRKEK